MEFFLILETYNISLSRQQCDVARRLATVVETHLFGKLQILNPYTANVENMVSF